MSSALTMRSGLPKSSSQGCFKPGIRKLETEKPTKPALGFAPIFRPVALHHEFRRQSQLLHQTAGKLPLE